MGVSTHTDWVVDVQRGPDWLIVRLSEPPLRPWAAWQAESIGLADQLWQLCQQHFTWRLIVDLHQLQLLTSSLIGQFLSLQRKLLERGGVLRMCGLSSQQAHTVRICRLLEQLPLYNCTQDAILGRVFTKPK